MTLLTALFVATCGARGADWNTHRGNAQRTGNIDEKPGPKSAKVLWVYESQEHFIGSPVIVGNSLFIAGLGTFNTATLHVFAADAHGAARELWTKRPPYLKQAMVCAPAVDGDKLVFGDGMHQTDGASLHCLMASTGRPIWQLPVPGALVHLEGSPTIANGKVYIGGGAAGVICVDLNRVTLNDKEVDAAKAQTIIEAKWKELSEQYEKDKKKDPDFAIPPSEDALPKAMPKRLWQAGQEKWHVDAAVAVAGNRVLVASAALDLEKVGDRALFCLDANNGTTKWRTPLQHNPWAGPTVAGDVVVLGCSSIRFDPKELPGKGEVVAVDLASGTVKWQKEVAGGIVSPISVAGGLAIFTCCDGKVRGWDIKDGSEKWACDAKAPFFAGPAVVGGVAYTADLHGGIHAINLADGKALWKLDLATDPTVAAPGMVYGSPVVHNGRLYMATCNIEAGPSQTKTVVVCIGEK